MFVCNSAVLSRPLHSNWCWSSVLTGGTLGCWGFPEHCMWSPWHPCMCQPSEMASPTPSVLPYSLFRISLCFLVPEPFHDLYVNIQKCQERKKKCQQGSSKQSEESRNKTGRYLCSAHHFQHGFHTDRHLSSLQFWEEHRTSSVSMLRSRAEQWNHFSGLHQKDGLVSKSLLCPSCQVPLKKLNVSFKNPMDLDLFGVKCALCRIWPNVGDTRRGLSTMGFEFLLLNCSEERGEKKPLSCILLRNRNVYLHSF